MLHFAYDGTINGDWVSRYAVRLASSHPDRALRVVCVDEGTVPREEIHRRLEGIGEECRAWEVSFSLEIVPSGPHTFAALDRAVPRGPDAFLVLGTRVRERGRGYLAGSIGERMLRAGVRRVIVFRVVNPGLLGMARQILIPVGGHPRGFVSGLPFLALLAPAASAFHLLHVRRVGRAAFRRLAHRRIEELRRDGARYCERVEGEIEGTPGIGSRVVDSHVVVSDDPPKEIVIMAARLKTELIYMGASERGLPHRLFYGSSIEQVLRRAPCDVAVYRGLS